MNTAEAGYTEIDTARAYSPHAPGTSEPLLGQTDCKEWALIDTKIPSSPGSGKAEKVAESVRLSLGSLGVSKVSK
jgi:aflatoxin B1 aldehyde reductase